MINYIVGGVVLIFVIWLAYSMAEASDWYDDFRGYR